MAAMAPCTSSHAMQPSSPGRVSTMRRERLLKKASSSPNSALAARDALRSSSWCSFASGLRSSCPNTADTKLMGRGRGASEGRDGSRRPGAGGFEMLPTFPSQPFCQPPRSRHPPPPPLCRRPPEACLGTCHYVERRCPCLPSRDPLRSRGDARPSPSQLAPHQHRGIPRRGVPEAADSTVPAGKQAFCDGQPGATHKGSWRPRCHWQLERCGR